MLLLSNYYRRTDIFDVFQHKNGVFLALLQLLEEKQGFFIVAETAFYPIACGPETYEHSIVFPVIVIDAVFLQCGRKDLPCWIV